MKGVKTVNNSVKLVLPKHMIYSFAFLLFFKTYSTC